MQRESGQASAAMMRGAGKITQVRTTLSGSRTTLRAGRTQYPARTALRVGRTFDSARTTLRAGATSRGIPLCPGESHIAFNACPNPTSGP